MFIVYVYTGHVIWDDAITWVLLAGMLLYRALQPVVKDYCV